ncbi:MAG: formamidopyrimidine-DNA glycosylase [Arenicella sp.]|jgi:formamidopyrimidine-DNA glycosylase
MPELPEVETTCRGISPHLCGKTLTQATVRNHSLRWPVPRRLNSILQGQTLKQVSRRAKYLLLEFDTGHLLCHLGMSGSMRICKANDAPKKHDHIDLIFGSVCLRYHDPRRFGAMLWTKEAPQLHELIRHLGPEPLSDAFDASTLFGKSRKRSQAIKTFIMDNKIVVGVGNIYANEALFNAKIKPTRPAGKLTKTQSEQLSAEIKTVLADAIEQGGTTLKDFVGGDGKPGYFAQKLKVYGRSGEPCVACSKPLKEIRLGQRSTVYCTQCQK